MKLKKFLLRYYPPGVPTWIHPSRTVSFEPLLMQVSSSASRHHPAIREGRGVEAEAYRSFGSINRRRRRGAKNAVTGFKQII